MTHRSVTQDTAWALLGQAIPLVVGLLTIPLIVRGLGPEGFGVLGLIWAVLGYFSLLDLGLGRATTKYVAEAIARQEPGATSSIVTSVVTAQAVLGVVGGLGLALLTPVLVGRVLGVPPLLQTEVRQAFWLVAAALPFVLVSLALRAAVEAARRFELSALIRAPSGAAAFLVPAGVVALGGKLVAVVMGLALVRLATCVAALAVLPRALPGFRWRAHGAWSTLRSLLGYGGWVALDNTIVPLLLYLERFVLGAVAGVAVVAYYTAPYEAVTRLLIVPGSLATVLVPTFSAVTAAGQPQAEVQRLVSRSVRYLALMLGGLTLLAVILAKPLMLLWLGVEYARRSAPALQVLALGVFAGALSHVPNSFLMGVGRADRVTQLHLVELPIHAGVTWLLIGRFGLMGAAWAWTARAIYDSVLLFVMAHRTPGVYPRRPRPDVSG